MNEVPARPPPDALLDRDAPAVSFKLRAPYEPQGDQPRAIRELIEGIARGDRYQTLLGVTGSGKTFTMANLIAAANRPTLIISRSEEHTSELQSRLHLVCRLLLEKKKKKK